MKCTRCDTACQFSWFFIMQFDFSGRRRSSWQGTIWVNTWRLRPSIGWYLITTMHPSETITISASFIHFEIIVYWVQSIVFFKKYGKQLHSGYYLSLGFNYFEIVQFILSVKLRLALWMRMLIYIYIYIDADSKFKLDFMRFELKLVYENCYLIDWAIVGSKGYNN